LDSVITTHSSGRTWRKLHAVDAACGVAILNPNLGRRFARQAEHGGQTKQKRGTTKRKLAGFIALSMGKREHQGTRSQDSRLERKSYIYHLGSPYIGEFACASVFASTVALKRRAVSPSQRDVRAAVAEAVPNSEAPAAIQPLGTETPGSQSLPRS